MTEKIRLTPLNSMAGKDFEQALDRHIDWGLHTLDLKNQIYGKSIDELLPQEANLIELFERRVTGEYDGKYSCYCRCI